ncbi:MAG TPA: competence/damage-inducible protein A [Longimicrobiales bacterium]|nr:competence/damage-inducible protein A [Longimicrobiales bacterium]
MSEGRAKPGVVAHLVCVGEELLHGQTVDTNAAWIARSLAALGIRVERKHTVGDRAADIRDAVGAAMRAADLVVTTGGLGPTRDDLTKEAVAELLGRELRLDEAVLRALEERFRARGFGRMPAPNRRQAEVPERAVVLPNAYGTAPGLLLEADGSVVVLLPGVPREMRGIFEDAVRPELERRFAARLLPVRHRLIHTTGIAESRLAELVDEALPEDLGPVTIAFLPDIRGVDLRLTASGVEEREAEAWLDRVERALEPVVARWRFQAPSGDVAEALRDALAAAGMTVAVAESCTGGLVAKRITDLPGASTVFLGGVVAYADRVKVEQLGVPPQDLAAHGAVSEEVARAMVRGVTERFGADAGIAVTGVAGPGGGSPEKPVGTVWVAVSARGRTEARLLHLVGERDQIRERSAQEAIARLLRLVTGSGAGT